MPDTLPALLCLAASPPVGWGIAVAARALPARLWPEETVATAPATALGPAVAGAVAVAAISAAVLPAGLVAVGGALGWVLLLAALIDLRHFALPDALTLPLIPAGLAVAVLTRPGPAAEVLADHAVGGALGYLVFAGIAALYRHWRGREGLGLGDAKLLAAAGAWVGWPGLPGVVLAAAGSALLVVLARRARGRGLDADQPIAFGPYLAAGFWLVWLQDAAWVP